VISYVDDDYVISDDRSGYWVSVLDKNFDDFNHAISAIVADMIRQQYYPNVWYINDHGNVDLLAIDKDALKVSIVESYV
jgi:hypothetical protein